MENLKREVSKIIESALGDPIVEIWNLKERILEQMRSYDNIFFCEVYVEFNSEDDTLWVCYTYDTMDSDDYNLVVFTITPDET